MRQALQGLAGEQLGQLPGRHRPASQSNRLTGPQIGEIAGARGLGLFQEDLLVAQRKATTTAAVNTSKAAARKR